MESKLTAVVAIATVVGVAVGASADSFFSKDVEFSRQIMSVRMETYKQYVSVQSSYSNATPELKPALLAQIDEVHKKIGVFGSAEAVNNLASFRLSHNASYASRTCAPATVTFLDSVLQMRQDLGIDATGDPADNRFRKFFRSMSGNFGVKGAGEPPAWKDIAILMWGCVKK